MQYRLTLLHRTVRSVTETFLKAELLRNSRPIRFNGWDDGLFVDFVSSYNVERFFYVETRPIC